MNTQNDPSRYHEIGRTTATEVSFRSHLDGFIYNSTGSWVEKMQNYPKYIPRQSYSRYIALYEIFKLVLDVQGDLIEGGVNWGGGLMNFAQLSAILEPYNLQRRIVGFDTFTGFPDVSEKDRNFAQIGKQHSTGGYAADSYSDLIQAIQLYDSNRPVGHVSKVSLIKGDACTTIPEYVSKNPHTLVSLLHLDFDIYEPTKVALESFLPLMAKGSVIVFDEINCPKWPGETIAVLEKLDIKAFEIKRFPFEPYISYAVL